MLSTMMMIIRRELLIAFRRQADIFNPLWFFIIVITLFPLSIGPEPGLLTRIAPGIVWVAAATPSSLPAPLLNILLCLLIKSIPCCYTFVWKTIFLYISPTDALLQFPTIPSCLHPITH